MNREEIKELQKELDARKYTSSCLAKCDMSGKMDYCKGCFYKEDSPICSLEHEQRLSCTTCAMNYIRLKEVKQSAKKNTRTTNRRKG